MIWDSVLDQSASVLVVSRCVVTISGSMCVYMDALVSTCSMCSAPSLGVEHYAVVKFVFFEQVDIYNFSRSYCPFDISIAGNAANHLTVLLCGNVGFILYLQQFILKINQKCKVYNLLYLNITIYIRI